MTHSAVTSATSNPVVTRAWSPVPISSASGGTDREPNVGVILLVVAGVAYNAVLAALNALGIKQSFSSVAIVEIAILGFAALRVFTLPYMTTDVRPLTLLYIGVLIAFYTSLTNERISVECLRNFAVISFFMFLGARFNERQLAKLFRIISVAVLIFLVVEILSTQLYVKIFQPALYYLNTRGIPLFALDSSGLFRGAIGFEGRFSFGLAMHRTSSIFIEQVSLANYAGVVCIYLIARFANLSFWDKAIHLTLVCLILLSNDSRTSSIFAAVCLVGYAVFPRFIFGATLLIMPSILAAGAILVSILGFSQSDDLRGRVSLTIDHLMSFDTITMLGLNADAIPAQLDSGYCFLIASSSLFGLLFFWIFCAFAIPGHASEQRRCLFSLNMYLFMNLMIGGTAIFSIKVAAPLWVLVGFMRVAVPLRSVVDVRAGRIHSVPIRKPIFNS